MKCECRASTEAIRPRGEAEEVNKEVGEDGLEEAGSVDGWEVPDENRTVVQDENKQGKRLATSARTKERTKRKREVHEDTPTRVEVCADSVSGDIV